MYRGSKVSAVKVEAGKTLTSLPTTTREGYIFDGWYDGSTKWTTSMIVEKDITLKAHWIKNGNGEAGKKELTPAKGRIFTVSKCKYKITDAKKFTVSIIGTSKKGKLTIGATVKIGGKSYKITGIGAKAFKNNKKLKSVVIGKNISSIGKQAFYGCKKLKSIVIKTKKLTAKKVGSLAFKKIYSKVKVRVPKKKKAGYRKFLKKKGLPTSAKIKI